MVRTLRKNASQRLRIYGRRSTFKTTIPTTLDINARYNELYYSNIDDYDARVTMTEEIIKIYDIMSVETVHEDTIAKRIKKCVDQFANLQKNWKRAQANGIEKSVYFKFNDLIGPVLISQKNIRI